MRKENGKIDYVLGGSLLVALSLATLYFEEAFFTINPIITLEDTPVLFWAVVIIDAAAGTALIIKGVRMQARATN